MSRECEISILQERVKVLNQENAQLKAELAEMKHAIQMHADLLNVNEEHLQKLLIQSDRELQQTKQEAEEFKAELENVQREFEDRDAAAKWYETLVTREKIGTSKTPSLRSYIEQLEAELAKVQQRQRMSDKNYDELERLLNEKTVVLVQAKHREDRLREALEDAIGAVSELIRDWPKDLAAPEIDKIAKWTHALEGES